MLEAHIGKQLLASSDFSKPFHPAARRKKAGPEGCSPDPTPKASRVYSKVLQEPLLASTLKKCRESILGAVKQLLTFAAAQLVHVELGKALFDALYKRVNGGRTAATFVSEESDEDALLNRASGQFEELSDSEDESDAVSLHALFTSRFKGPLEQFFSQFSTILLADGRSVELGMLARVNFFLPTLLEAWGFVLIHFMRHPLYNGKSGASLSFPLHLADRDADFLVNLCRDTAKRCKKHNLGSENGLVLALDELDKHLITAQRLQIFMNSGLSPEDQAQLAWAFGEEAQSPQQAALKKEPRGVSSGPFGRSSTPGRGAGLGMNGSAAKSKKPGRSGSVVGRGSAAQRASSILGDKKFPNLTMKNLFNRTSGGSAREGSEDRASGRGAA